MKCHVCGERLQPGDFGSALLPWANEYRRDQEVTRAGMHQLHGVLH